MTSETTGLDEVDLAIVHELQSDGRRSVIDIAKALRVNRNTVSAKLKRLLDERFITPAIHVNPPELGYHTSATIGIKTAAGAMDSVANRMASLANVHFVFVCLGRYDVIVWCLFPNQDELYVFVTNELGSTPGVIGTEIMVNLGMKKVSFVLLNSAHPPTSYDCQRKQPNPGSASIALERTELDEVDLAIIRELQCDARQPTAALARTLGLHRNTIAMRLKRLSDQGTVSAVIAPNPTALGYQVMVAMGISVLPEAIDAAALRLRSSANIHSVTICTGRYDIMLWGFFHDHEELCGFMRRDLGQTPGIRSNEAMVIMQVKKMSFSYLEASCL